jgi:hypothetical protein
VSDRLFVACLFAVLVGGVSSSYAYGKHVEGISEKAAQHVAELDKALDAAWRELDELRASRPWADTVYLPSQNCGRLP